MRTMKSAAMLAVLGVAVPSRAAVAQRASAVPGDRVRVEACEPNTGAPCRRIVGAFVSWTPDRIVLRDSTGTELQIAAGPRSEVELSRGRSSSLGKGLLYGFLGGAALGGIMTALCADGAGEDVALCGAWLPIGAGVGTALGGLAGAMSTTERWAPASRPEGLTIAPWRAGVRVAYSQSF